MFHVENTRAIFSKVARIDKRLLINRMRKVKTTLLSNNKKQTFYKNLYVGCIRTRGQSKSTFAQSGRGLTKANIPYKNCHFPYMKSEQGGGQNWPKLSKRTWMAPYLDPHPIHTPHTCIIFHSWTQDCSSGWYLDPTNTHPADTYFIPLQGCCSKIMSSKAISCGTYQCGTPVMFYICFNLDHCVKWNVIEEFKMFIAFPT